jgi:predicted outer membrane repeat protein
MVEQKYKEYNGTSYNVKTPEFMVKILDRIYRQQIRVRFHWGNMQTGEDWGDVYDVSGRIGRSTGIYKVPLLIHNKGSTGGGAISTDSIVMIRYANKKDGGVIWKHPNYHVKKR